MCTFDELHDVCVTIAIYVGTAQERLKLIDRHYRSVQVVFSKKEFVMRCTYIYR